MNWYSLPDTVRRLWSCAAEYEDTARRVEMGRHRERIDAQVALCAATPVRNREEGAQ